MSALGRLRASRDLGLALLGFVLVALALDGEEARSKPFDLNRASVEELQTLPGVGPAIAQRIVAHREKNGRFRRVEELLIIRGISRKKFEKIRPLITVGAEPTEGEKRRTEKKPR